MSSNRRKFNPKEFAERIKDLRLERGLSIRDMEEYGFSKSAFSAWETCTNIPSAEAIFDISEFLGVSADYLLGLKDS